MGWNLPGTDFFSHPPVGFLSLMMDWPKTQAPIILGKCEAMMERFDGWAIRPIGHLLWLSVRKAIFGKKTKRIRMIVAELWRLSFSPSDLERRFEPR